MILAVLIDGDDRPVCSEMRPGNTADVSTFIPDQPATQAFDIAGVCVVADRGMISADRRVAAGGTWVPFGRRHGTRCPHLREFRHWRNVGSEIQRALCMTVPRPEARRRKTARCPVCKERFQYVPAAAAPTFCGASCHQRAYEQRKWSRPHPVELLARDIASARVRDFIREQARELLLEAEIILPSPAPKPKRRHPPLRLVPK